MWSSHLKSRLRRASYRVGLSTAVGRFLKGRAHVIMYHRVERRPVGRWGRPALDVETFSEQVEYLTRNFEVVPLSVLVAGLRSGRPPSRAVSLTFDDGYRNNLLLAFPVLWRNRAPATVFVAAGLVGTQGWLWPDELSEMALRYGLDTLIELSGDRLLSSLCTAELPNAVRMEVAIDYLVRAGPESRNAILARLRSSFPIEPDDESKFLSWNEVRALHAGGMEIGSHTVSHPVLTQISRSEVERELAASRNTIAEEVGQVPSLFCYPHGSFTEDIKQQTARYYGAAVSTMAGGNTPATDPLELRRIAAYNVEDLAFEMARPR